MSEPQRGRALLACGIAVIVTVIGVAHTIHGACKRGEERGDW